MHVPVSARRHAPALAVALAAALALAACSAPDGGTTADGADAADGGAATSALLPTAEGSTSYPLTLTTWAGESVLEERPERIAVIGFSPNRDALEALGVTPVYTMGDLDWEWSEQAWLDEVELVDTATRRDPVNLEGIASTNPDLIVAVNFVADAADHERLAEIAPVLENPEQVAGEQIDWRATQRLIGEALDLADASEQVVQEADDAITATAAAHPEWEGRTVTIAYDYATSGLDYYTTTGGTAEQVVEQLGFAPNPLAERFVQEASVSDEQLALLDADVLVVFYDDEPARTSREGMELFQAVPAVAEGRYVAVVADQPDSGANATWVLRRGASALSLPWATGAFEGWMSEVELGS